MSDIRINLSTYLNDAGIKATSAQIDALAAKVKKVDADAASGAERAANAIGRLPGPLGKLQGILGGVAAKVSAVAGAFTLGWDIGTKLNNNVIKPLLGITDAVDEVKKHNAELNREFTSALARWNERLNEWSASWAKTVSGIDAAKTGIEDATQAYLRMAAAKDKVRETEDDAETLGIRRDRYEAMSAAATPDDAALAGKYYDVLLAEAEQRQKLAKYDADAETQSKKAQNAAAALEKADEKRVALKRQLAEVEEKLASVDSQEAANALGFSGTAQAEKALAAKRDSLAAQIASADRDVSRREAERDAVAVEMSATAQARENIRAETQLEIDERRSDYETYAKEVEARQAQLADEDRRRKLEAVRAEEAARVQMQQRLAAERIKEVQDEISRENSLRSSAESRRSAADSKLSQAWGYYRDQSSMQAVLDEQKAQAEAEKQWQKDFERLKSRRRDWRTAEFGSLSAADESVRQVALAKEEKAAADQYLQDIDQNTKALADKLDELLQVK